ncbi:MAG: FGGY family carbohydrate kinase [Saprospiraceae bacterium]|nr:FGGY family carbohydrate kinase [Saprospiraceae bacterium]
MFLLGYDIGSSSIKVALVNANDGSVLGMAQHPETEMPIASPQPDWAEQNPEDWWEAACIATQKLMAKTRIPPGQIAAIGIAYQMHGLVVVDQQGQVLRPAIIWCDSRAVAIGDQAFKTLGAEYCLENYLNSPGNFTASKLRWIRENEPAVFDKIAKIMLPGDYIAYRMTGEICTTVTGLSEGIFWNFKKNGLATALLEHYQIPETLLADLVPVFAQQGKLRSLAAAKLGLLPGIPIGYRSGDQPNNALALNVLRPGEVAATGGTSGVVYAVAESPVYDPQQRVNSFAHVNYSLENPLTGVLLCINGAGSLYRWVRENLGGLSYGEMEQLAATVPIGSEGLSILPFGNGAERMLGNHNPGAQVFGLQFNRHEQRHFFRAALEGIAFAFVYGMKSMRELGIPIHTLRVGNDNLFQSAIFSETISTLMAVEIELLATTGAVGAAKAAGVSVGIFQNPEEAMAQHLDIIERYKPASHRQAEYAEAYYRWLTHI